MSIINVGATPGTFLTFLTLAAIVVASLSTTFIKAIFFVKITPSDPTDTRFLTLGLWGTCLQNTGPLECESPKFGYTFDRSRLNIIVPDGVVIPTIGNALGYLTIVHLFAILTLLITLLLGIVAHIRHIRAEKLLIGIASQISILSTGVLLFAFIVDFLMFNNGVMSMINTINTNSKSADSYKATFGIAYWLVLISLIISVIAAIAFFLGRKYIIRKNFSIEDESSEDITNPAMVLDPADRYDPFKKTTQPQPTYPTSNNMVANNNYGYDNDNRIVNNYPADDDNFAYDNIQKLPYPPNYLQQPQQPINLENIEYSQQNNTNKHTSGDYSLDEFYSYENAPSNLQPPYQNSPHPPPMHNNNGFNNPPHSTQSSTSNVFYSASSPSSPVNQKGQLQPPQLPLHSKPTPTPSPAPNAPQFLQPDSSIRINSPIQQSSSQQYQKLNQPSPFNQNATQLSSNLPAAVPSSNSSDSSNSSLYQQPLYRKKPPGHSNTSPQPSNQLPFGAVTSSPYNSSAPPRPGYTTPPQPSSQLPFGAVTSAPYNSSTSPRPGYTTPPQPSSKLPFGAVSSSYNSPTSPRPGYTTPQPSNQLPLGAASSSFNSSLPRPQQQPFNSGNTPYNYQQQNRPNLGMRQQQQRQQDLRTKQQRLPPQQQQQQQRPGLLMKQQQQQQRTRQIPKQQPTNRPRQRQNKGEAVDDQQQEEDQQQEGDDQQQQEGDQEVEDQTEDQAAQDMQDSYYDSNQDGDHYGQTDYSGGDDVSQQYYEDSSQYQQEDQFPQQDNDDYYQQPQDDYYYQQQTQDDYNQPQDDSYDDSYQQPQDDSYQQPQDDSYQQSQDIYESQDMYNQDDSSYQPQDNSYQQSQDIYGSQDMYNQDDSSYQPQDDSYQQSQDIYGSQDMYQPEDNSYQEQPLEYDHQQKNPDQSGFFSDPKDNPVSGFFSNTNNNGPSSVGGAFNQIKNPVSKMKFFK